MNNAFINKDTILSTRNFIENTSKRLDIKENNNVYAYEKSNEEIMELLEVIMAIKKNRRVYDLDIVDKSKYLQKQRALYDRLCEEYAHTILQINNVGISILKEIDRETEGELDVDDETYITLFSSDLSCEIESKKNFFKHIIKEEPSN